MGLWSPLCIPELGNFFPYTSAEDKQKCIDIESACELLDLVLGFQFRSQVDKLIEYLKVNISSSLCIFCSLKAWPEIGHQFIISSINKSVIFPAVIIVVFNSMFCYFCKANLIFFVLWTLQYQHDYKVINLDQWMNFLRFCNEVWF